MLDMDLAGRSDWLLATQSLEPLDVSAFQKQLHINVGGCTAQNPLCDCLNVSKVTLPKPADEGHASSQSQHVW